MTVRLRPHHLLCMLTYVGKGYSPKFIANYDAIAARLSAGEDILVVEGPDDICAALLCEAAPHCRNASVVARDRLAARDVGEILGLRIEAGARIVPDSGLLNWLRTGFARGTVRAACAGCEWTALCDGIAAAGFAGARVMARD